MVIIATLSLTVAFASHAGAATIAKAHEANVQVSHDSQHCNSAANIDGSTATQCVQSWSTAITISYQNVKITNASETASWAPSTGSCDDPQGCSLFFSCEGPNFSVLINLPAGGWNVGASLSTGTTQSNFFTYDNLVVGGSNTTPPPTTSCTPPPPNQGHVNPPVVGMASTADGQGYWEVGSDGSVHAAGDANWLGDMSGQHLNKPIVGIAATADGKGYWLDASDGGIFAFGDAPFYGSTGSLVLNKPMVSMASTKDGGGYWLVAADGGIFAFGDAQFYGSMGSIPLNKPVVGMATDYASGGYWMVASDGGIFSFNAPFFGSTGSIHLNAPIIEMEAPISANGYRFVASDGGVFCFGGASFQQSLGGTGINDIAGMAASGNDGYWLAESNGVVHPFGTAPNVS